MAPSSPRKLVRRIPGPATWIGIIVVFLSFAYFAFTGDGMLSVLGIAFGLLLMLFAVWQAAHPYLSNAREFPRYRDEVDRLLDHARVLIRARDGGASREEVDEIKEAMRSSVDRLDEVAERETS